jgi:DNA-binding CsgD family transcriptional regulator
MGTRKIDKDEVLQIWLDNPRLQFKEIAEKAGIDPDTFYRYRKDS